MNTWEIAVPTCFLTAGQASPCARNFSADIISAIGERRFDKEVLIHLNDLLPVDFLAVYRINPEGPPRMFISASLGEQDVSIDCFRRYRRGLYQKDSTFSSARKMISDGSGAMTLWNEAEIPTPHREQIYRRHGIRERLSVVSGEPGGSLLALNLYRYQSSGVFRATEIDLVESLVPVLIACVRKQIQFASCVDTQMASTLKSSSESLMSICPDLTPREVEVCDRLLRGMTYDGIAHDLGLAPTSIKTYRARAFDRLGIRFRNELVPLVFGRSGRA